MVKTFLPTKNVGSPCDSFSVQPGIALQIRRTRRRWSSAVSALCSFATGPGLLLSRENRRFPSRIFDQKHKIITLGLRTFCSTVASDQIARKGNRGGRKIEMMCQRIDAGEHRRLGRPLVRQKQGFELLL